MNITKKHITQFLQYCLGLTISANIAFIVSRVLFSNTSISTLLNSTPLYVTYSQIFYPASFPELIHSPLISLFVIGLIALICFYIVIHISKTKTQAAIAQFRFDLIKIIVLTMSAPAISILLIAESIVRLALDVLLAYTLKSAASTS